jgi:hypothetical protein
VRDEQYQSPGFKIFIDMDQWGGERKRILSSGAYKVLRNCKSCTSGIGRLSL